MLMELQNQNWEMKNNLLFDENKRENKGFIERIKANYLNRILNKTKLYYYKFKSTLDEPMFPY